MDAASVYNVAQMALYGGMAAIIMRLKLFLTPQLCVVAGMLASKRQVGNFKMLFQPICTTIEDP